MTCYFGCGTLGNRVSYTVYFLLAIISIGADTYLHNYISIAHLIEIDRLSFAVCADANYIVRLSLGSVLQCLEFEDGRMLQRAE